MEENYETIEHDLSDEEFCKLARMAHEKDITFNQLVAEILIRKAEEILKENEQSHT